MDREPREHPLLMRPELVRATLAGAKTQTRRLVTPGTSTVRGCWPSARAVWSRLDFAGATAAVARPPDGSPDTPVLVVPFAKGDEHEGDVVTVWPRVRPGDAVYVRETWQTGAALDDEAPSMLAAWAKAGGVEPCGPVRYKADGATRDAHLLAHGSHYGEHWGRGRPGIHLPRWACRLVLPVESVRGERARDISEADALAEGVNGVPFRPDDGFPVCTGYTLGEDDGKSVLYPTAREAFIAGFDTINDHRAKPAGDWVWVYQWPAVQP